MILMGRNAQQIGGITIFPDHENPKQFWYLSGNVQLAQRNEQSVFTLIKYNQNVKEKVAGGGYVTFEVNIGLPEKLEQAIRRRLPEDANLAPVPFNLGTVKCLALDVGQQQTLGAASPTLYGDNAAIFSLKLNEAQTAILEQAFTHAGQPIGVIYDLEYTAMTPALDVKLTADLARVYTEFQATIGFQGILPVNPPLSLDASIEAGFQRLVQNGAIQMEVFTFIDDEDVKRQKEEALRFFMDTLLKDWFEPTLALPKIADEEDQDDMALTDTTDSGSTSGTADEGEKAPEDIGEDAKDVADGIEDIAEEVLPQAKVKLRFVHQEEFKVVTYRFSGAQATKKKYYPQGFFSRLLRDVEKGTGIIAVDIDDPFFRTIKIAVEAPQVSYDKYGLQSVHFAAKYPDREIASLVFDKAHNENKSAEFAVNRALDTSYDYQVQYNFVPDGDWDGERMTYEIPWQKTDDRAQVLIPHKHLQFFDINVSLEAGFYWEKLQEVQVRLTYQSPQRGWRKNQVLRFYPGSASEQHWKLRLNAEDPAEFTYQLFYQLEDGSTKSTEPVTSDIPAISVPDLTKKKLAVRVVPLLDPKIDQQVFLDLNYADPANNYTWESHVTLKAGPATPLDVQIPLMDAAKPEFEYTLTFIHTNNATYQQAFPKGKYTQILVQSIASSDLAVEISPQELDWNLLRRVTVELRYQDAPNNIDQAQSITLSSGDVPFKWQVALANKSVKSYQWRATFYTKERTLGEQGAVRYPAEADGWATAADPVLLLSRYQPQAPQKPVVQEGALEIEIVPDDVDWHAVRRLVVNLLYEDAQNNIRKSERKTFQEGDSAFLWQLQLKDNRLTRYQWQATFYMKDTAVGDRGKLAYPAGGGWESTDEAVLFLDSYQKTPSWMAFSLIDEDGQPVANEPYKVILPDGKVREGQVDAQGRARLEGILAESCTITFPNLDAEDWGRG